MSHEKFLDAINLLITKVIIPYQGSLLVDLRLLRRSCGRYILVYTVSSNFNNKIILKEACFDTTDKILEWCDFTDVIYDFDVEILTPGSRYCASYYELMQETIAHKRQIITHPRRDKYHQYYEEYYKIRGYFYNGEKLIFKPKEFKKKTFLGKLKEFFVSLWSKK
jgi:hypothetical protein